MTLESAVMGHLPRSRRTKAGMKNDMTAIAPMVTHIAVVLSNSCCVKKSGQMHTHTRSTAQATNTYFAVILSSLVIKRIRLYFKFITKIHRITNITSFFISKLCHFITHMYNRGTMPHDQNIKQTERYVGDVSAVRNPMHGASANVHGASRHPRRINLGEVVTCSRTCIWLH